MCLGIVLNVTTVCCGGVQQGGPAAPGSKRAGAKWAALSDAAAAARRSAPHTAARQLEPGCILRLPPSANFLRDLVLTQRHTRWQHVSISRRAQRSTVNHHACSKQTTRGGRWRFKAGLMGGYEVVHAVVWHARQDMIQRQDQGPERGRQQRVCSPIQGGLQRGDSEGPVSEGPGRGAVGGL